MKLAKGSQIGVSPEYLLQKEWSVARDFTTFWSGTRVQTLEILKMFWSNENFWLIPVNEVAAEFNTLILN